MDFSTKQQLNTIGEAIDFLQSPEADQIYNQLNQVFELNMKIIGNIDRMVSDKISYNPTNRIRSNGPIIEEIKEDNLSGSVDRKNLITYPYKTITSEDKKPDSIVFLIILIISILVIFSVFKRK